MWDIVPWALVLSFAAGAIVQWGMTRLMRRRDPLGELIATANLRELGAMRRRITAEEMHRAQNDDDMEGWLM